MILDNGFTAISCFIFLSPKSGDRIYTNFPEFIELIIWVIKSLQMLHLTECGK